MSVGFLTLVHSHLTHSGERSSSLSTLQVKFPVCHVAADSVAVCHVAADSGAVCHVATDSGAL
jgi:hypothetical protein